MRLGSELTRAEDERSNMSADNPKKTTRTTGTAKKRGGAQTAPAPVNDHTSEEPVLPVEQAIELAAPAFEDIEAEIRRCAYEIYLSRGGADGDDLSDWLAAERLVRSGRRPDAAQRARSSSEERANA